MTDPYKVLGVEKSATLDQIKAAYKTLAKKHHPDVGGNAEEFKKINEAYQTLSDPVQKAQYDSGGQKFHQYSNGWSGVHSEEVLNEILKGLNVNFDEIFGRAKNRDVHVNVALSLEEAYSGGKKAYSIKTVDGTEQTINVEIPAGVNSGQSVKFPGLGDNSNTKIKRGDLIIRFVVKEHDIFKRYGLDLEQNVTINAFDAILGTKVTVPTIKGTSVEVTIPPGSQYGSRLKLSGHGMKDSKDRIGNMYLIISVHIPTQLTNTDKEILEKLRSNA